MSFIERKPEPLGTEFKNAADAQSGIFLDLEIQKGMLAMQKARHWAPGLSKVACPVRLAENVAGDATAKAKAALAERVEKGEPARTYVLVSLAILSSVTQTFPA